MNIEISNIIIYLTLLLIAILSTNNNYSGTLVATVITQNQIFLFSDGTVTDKRTGKVLSTEVSKVHRISNHVGLLTVGVFIYNLDTQIQNYGKEKDLNNVVVVTDIVKRVLKEEWEKRKLTKDRRMFVFVVGYGVIIHRDCFISIAIMGLILKSESCYLMKILWRLGLWHMTAI